MRNNKVILLCPVLDIDELDVTRGFIGGWYNQIDVCAGVSVCIRVCLCVRSHYVSICKA